MFPADDDSIKKKSTIFEKSQLLRGVREELKMKVLPLIQAAFPLLQSLTTRMVPTTNFVPLSRKLPSLATGKRRIFLIRHGETDWNAAGKVQGDGYDLELNHNGRRQAETVAQELQEVSLGVIASSHLQRAQQTADAIYTLQQQQQQQQQHDGTVAQRMIHRGFGEMKFGEFEGVALRGAESSAHKDIVQRYLACNDAMKLDKDIAWPGGGESLSQVEARSTDALWNLIDTHSSTQYFGIVAHGRMINILLASLLRGDVCQFATFHQRNCCINVLDVDPTTRAFESVVLSYDEHIERIGKLKP